MNATTSSISRTRAAVVAVLFVVIAVFAVLTVGALSGDDGKVTAVDRTEQADTEQVDTEQTGTEQVDTVDPAAGACLVGSPDCADIPAP